MSVLYEVLDPKDGEPVGYRTVKGVDDAENPALVFEEMPEGAVWDGERGAPREPTEGALLEARKAAKTEEIAAAAIDSLAPLFTDGKGRDETALLVAGHVLKLCEALKVPVDPRLRTVVQTGERALAKRAEVEGAGSVEEVGAVQW